MGICAVKEEAQYEHCVYKDVSELPFAAADADSFIGKGAFGFVDAVKGTSGRFKGIACARKTISFDEMEEQEVEAAQRSLQQEARILNRARHGHVVRLFMTYFYESRTGPRFAMIMDYADGHLDDYLKLRKSRAKVSHLAQWFGCLVGAVAYIHKIGIRHRDIKPTNILVKNEGVLLADFGISKMGVGKTIRTTAVQARSRTQNYCAPEVDNGSTRGRSADIFSLGAVFLEMLIAHSYPAERGKLAAALAFTGGPSYPQKIDKVHEFMKHLRTNVKSDSWQSTVLSLCMEMLQKDRNTRPRAEDAVVRLMAPGEPLAPCTCEGGGLRETSNNDRLVKACEEGSLEDVAALLHKGADPSTMGAIHQASANGHTGVVKALLDRQAVIDIQDAGGQTALHYAAGHRHLDVLQVLLEGGSDVMVEDEDGKTALDHALQGSSIAVLLQEAEARVRLLQVAL